MSSELRATARSGSNVAFVKFWGKRDPSTNVPLNDSISMTLTGAVTLTTVAYDPDLRDDEVYLDGERVLDDRARRVSRHLDRIREHYYPVYARVASMNSFPMGTGLASSASGFAALTTAAIAAHGEGLPDEATLSRWARRGSGSACRSVLGGFVRWRAGMDDRSSFAEPLFGPDWWDLRDLCVVLSARPKEMPTAQGHRLATAHPFMPARQQGLPRRIAALGAALAQRDIEVFGQLVEQEAYETQAIMLSSEPPCLVLLPSTVSFLREVRHWREDGLAVYVTLDAGPNPHLICEGSDAGAVLERIAALAPDAEVLHCRPGPGVQLVEDHLL